MASSNPKHHAHRKTNVKGLAIYLIIAIIIIAIALYALTYRGVQDLGSSGNVTISSNGTVFILGGVEYAAYMGSGSTLYISKQPSFVNPLMAVSLSKDTTIHANYMSKYADIGVELLSLNGTSALVRFITISQSAAVAPDSTLIRIVSTNSSATTTSTISPPPSKSSNSTKSGSTTTTTVATTITTTASQPNGYSKALSALQASKYYSLMENYSELYHNTSYCTPSLYNKTYESNNYGVPPSGPQTYKNVSAFVPFNMTYALNDVSGPIYRANYTTISKSTITTGTALSMIINSSDGVISNVTYSGIFAGTNESTLYQGYLSAVRIGGACGIYIP
ncbi:MAG: hypothetical protein QXT94_02615 [Methanothrix sp.]